MLCCNKCTQNGTYSYYNRSRRILLLMLNKLAKITENYTENVLAYSIAYSNYITSSVTPPF